MKRRILYISMCMPFDKAFHAGGKTFNYYINSFADDPDNEVTLITKVLPDEEKYIETVNSKIKTYYVSTPKKRIKKYVSYIRSLNSKFNPWYPYGNVLSKEIYAQIESNLKKFKQQNYEPHVVILEWTWILLFIDVVKKYFPNSIYVASEHDVAFLGLERRVNNSKGFISRKKSEIYYNNIKERELISINKCDYVVTHNDKDRRLLIENGISEEKLGTIVPYFEQKQELPRNSNNRDIVFYGAMNRMENSESAIWFINKVMPLLDELDIRFVIVGNKPPENLLKLQNERIICTGYVECINPYFSSAMCVVAPLQDGAGIKVKILEAMALGAPVLTNEIGIEGIDAVDREHFIYCETPSEFASVIKDIYTGKIDAEKIARNAVKMMKDSYDLNTSFVRYSSKVYELIKKEE